MFPSQKELQMTFHTKPFVHPVVLEKKTALWLPFLSVLCANVLGVDVFLKMSAVGSMIHLTLETDLLHMINQPSLSSCPTKHPYLLLDIVNVSIPIIATLRFGACGVNYTIGGI